MLVLNNIIVVDKEVGKFRIYRLADNDIVKYLVSSALAQSFIEAENPVDGAEQLRQIEVLLGETGRSDKRAGGAADTIEMPIDGKLTLKRQTAEKLSALLDDALKSA